MNPDVTQILRAIDSGEAKAAGELLPLVYDELRRLARHRMSGESADHTLQATALVHEAYLRLVGTEDPGWQNRAHFFAAAAEAMRRILVESARRKQRQKHGGGLVRVELDDAIAEVTIGPSQHDVLAIDEALTKFAQVDPVKARLIELRYFAGLSADEAAGVLQISPATADRYWAFARAWLYRELAAIPPGAD